VEQVIEPEMPEDCEGLDRLLIGEDVSERLDVTPAKFQVIVTRRRNMPTETVMSVLGAGACPHHSERHSHRSIVRKPSMPMTASNSASR